MAGSCDLHVMPPCSFSEGEIHFNLMAIVGDRRKRFQKEIDRQEARQDTAAKMVST